MNFMEWIKDKIITIILLISTMITIYIFLLPYNLPVQVLIYIVGSISIVYTIGLFIEFYQRKVFYKKIQNLLEELPEKYLITELLKEPSFIEGKILKDILQQTHKSMIEHVNSYKYNQEEYKEYIETWIHEIKTPIATGKMIVENNRNEVTKSIEEELDKIDNYVEQALFYARSNTVEKDYCIKKVSLKQVVNTVIKRNKNAFIQEKIKANLHDLDIEVRTDSKWCMFILNQIIQNSIRYLNKENKEIEIWAIKQKEKVELYIKDNGVGIKEEELPRVFEKGFTGTNGRQTNKKSTGIGLYLCKKLCQKLRLGIQIQATEGVGTIVCITFLMNSYMIE